MYENGKGVDKFIDMAFMYYSQAAELGNAQALLVLEAMYKKSKNEVQVVFAHMNEISHAGE